MIALVLFSGTVMAEIRAYVDRNAVRENESFYLTIEQIGQSTTTPNFNDLKRDFEIGRVMSGVSVQMINGSMYSKNDWKLMLVPKRAGKVNIPAIKIGNEITKPIPIKVTKQKKVAGKIDNVFFESSLSTTTPYVQQNILYTVRFYFRQPFIDTQSRLALPKIDGKELQLIEDPKRFLSNKNGVDYQVFEFRFKLFAPKSGDLVISAPSFKGVMIINNSGGLTYDAFARNVEQKVYRKGKSYHLKVKPIPASYHGDWWLPAQSVTLSEDWSKSLSSLKTGESVTRKITLSATGVSQSQLPELKFSDIDGLNIYPDKPQIESKTVGGKTVVTKSVTVAYVPSVDKKFNIPPIEISWWDVKEDKQKIASLKTHHIVVKAATAPVVHASSPQPVQPVINSSRQSEPQAQQQSRSPHWFSWYIMLPLVLSGWVFGAIALFRTRNKREQLQTDLKKNDSFKKTMKQLKHACQQKNASQAYHLALASAKLFWSEKNILNLNDVLQFVADDELSQVMTELNNIRYAENTKKDWDGMGFYHCFYRVIMQKKKEKPARQDGLPPIFVN